MEKNNQQTPKQRLMMHCILDCEHGSTEESTVAFGKIVKLVGEEKAMKLAALMKRKTAVCAEYEKMKIDFEELVK